MLSSGLCSKVWYLSELSVVRRCPAFEWAVCSKVCVVAFEWTVCSMVLVSGIQ